MENQPNLPLVSTIIANFNYSEWILGAIESAVNQDYPVKNIYVIDDCSTDDSVNKIKEFCGQEYTIGFINNNNESHPYHISLRNCQGVKLYLIEVKQNGGPSRARNFAIEHALKNGTNIVAILDGDDKMFPSKISRCVSQILSDPQTIGGVYGDYAILNVDTNQITYESKYSYNIFLLKAGESCVHSGAVYSSLALEYVRQTCGFYYPPYLTTAEDFFLNRVIAQRYLFLHLAEMLTLVRAHNNSSVNYRSKDEWQKNYQIAMSVPL